MNGLRGLGGGADGASDWGRAASSMREQRARPLRAALGRRFTGQRNLNLAMLRGGYAFLYGGSRQPDDYRQAEAREDKRGIWIFTDLSNP